MRAKIAGKLNPDKGIRWRSHEPSRIETFSDAAFAFALTLIIVSLEVPKTFDELMETMKGGLSFALCFIVLFYIWNAQNVFFRRFGLNDDFTITVNAILLFVVLIYTYPLKFLFELLTSNGEIKFKMITPVQVPQLMLIYGAGLITIYILFYLLYRHAQKFATELELTPAELYETKTLTNINLLCICICIPAMSIAAFFPEQAGRSGYVYFLFPVVYSTWFAYRGKKKRKLFPRAV
jgi:uncharacterized membrane protein